VTLDGPRAIAGALAGGDNVTIYATFEGVKISLVQKDFLNAVQQGSVSGLQVQGELPEFDTTVVLSPEVEVLRVTREGSGDPAQEVSDAQSAQGNTTLTLAFLPDEAQRFVFAMELGKVYLALLPTDEAGTELEPLTFARVFLPEKTK
jgi:Flp pilus assembly protein RcpC/CpaB